MDLKKTGEFLRRLRKENGLTQAKLAEKLNVSAKTISKWECGNGFPDINILSNIADLFCVGAEQLLSGDIVQNKEETGNMKNIRFYVCPGCGSIMTGMGECELSCCGRRLMPAAEKKADAVHKVDVSVIENDYYITFEHPMTKEHYIAFAAYVRFDSVFFVRLYPEQGSEVRIPFMGGGRLYIYCSVDGLFEVKI